MKWIQKERKKKKKRNSCSWKIEWKTIGKIYLYSMRSSWRTENSLYSIKNHVSVSKRSVDRAENILILLKEYIYSERDGFSPILEKLTITYKLNRSWKAIKIARFRGTKANKSRCEMLSFVSNVWLTNSWKLIGGFRRRLFD